MNTNNTMIARYNQAANAVVLELLNKLSNDEREKDRGSYYKSLSGLARHLGGATFFFSGMYKAAVTNAAAIKALAPLETVQFPEGNLTEAQWAQVAAGIASVDKALVDFCAALTDDDFNAPVKWFTDNPPTVPLSFMLNGLMAHNTHHRGQISQILDELKIEHDFSGIDVTFC
ncbi:diguanylate cyclase [Spirochaetia bacterium]|nr:diguanylate cyclase [Spirochaetia bacterium]